MESKPVFFELTPQALQAIWPEDDSPELRGMWLLAKRERPVYNAPMIASVTTLDRPCPQLPQDQSPVPTLGVLWGMQGELC